MIEAISFLQNHIISYFFIITLLIITIENCQKIKLEIPVKIIRIILISYALIGIINLFSHLLSDTNSNEHNYLKFLDRATGIYYLYYLVSLILSLFLPLLLLFKKTNQSRIFTLIICFIIVFGSWFERYVIIVTSLNRGQLSDCEIPNYIYFNSLTIGFAITIILITINIGCYFNKKRIDSEIIDS